MNPTIEKYMRQWQKENGFDQIHIKLDKSVYHLDGQNGYFLSYIIPFKRKSRVEHVFKLVDTNRQVTLSISGHEKISMEIVKSIHMIYEKYIESMK